MTNPWIEAMRLRTLPVSVAGVAGGCGVSLAYHCFSPLPAIICLLFALGAQILSNFANEYFDYRNGIDKPGREGFRRGLAEGDLSPRAMLRAMIILGIIVALLGLSLLYWGGWLLIPVGILIFIGALGYSGGPWPLSHHGLGDLAVVIFYGLTPVYFTLWLQMQAHGVIDTTPAEGALEPLQCGLLVGTAIGLMGANVLIVNNYRDADSDRLVGKKTTVVIFGRKNMERIYLAFWLIADLLLFGAFWSIFSILEILVGIIIFAPLQLLLTRKLSRNRGSSLNALLRQTSILLCCETLLCLGFSIFT